jgi:hypothetical protein
MVLGKLDIRMWKNVTRSLSLNAKWIKDLTLRPETLKVQEENRGKHCAAGNNFLYWIPIGKEIIARINIWDGITLKSFYTANEIIQ